MIEVSELLILVLLDVRFVSWNSSLAILLFVLLFVALFVLLFFALFVLLFVELFDELLVVLVFDVEVL